MTFRNDNWVGRFTPRTCMWSSCTIYTATFSPPKNFLSSSPWITSFFFVVYTALGLPPFYASHNIIIYIYIYIYTYPQILLRAGQRKFESRFRLPGSETKPVCSGLYYPKAISKPIFCISELQQGDPLGELHSGENIANSFNPRLVSHILPLHYPLHQPKPTNISFQPTLSRRFGPCAPSFNQHAGNGGVGGRGDVGTELVDGVARGLFRGVIGGGGQRYGGFQ